MPMDHPKVSAFISYNWADKPLARALAAGLEWEGYRVWIDEGALRAGDSIVQRVSEAIARVDLAVGRRVHRVDDDRLYAESVAALGVLAQHGVHDRHDVTEALPRSGAGG